MENRKLRPPWQTVVALSMGLAVWSSLAVSQPQAKEQSLTDSSGNKLIRGFKEVVFEIVSPGQIRFEGHGSPIRGLFKAQGISLETTRIDGLVASENRTYRLDSATLEGNVKVVLSRPSASGKEGATQQIELKTPKAVYAFAGEMWTLSGPVSVHRTDEAAQEDMRLDGSGATVALYGQDRPSSSETGIKTARIEKGVLKLKTRRREPVKDKPGTFEFKRYTIDGSADSISFDDAKRQITFLGNVHFTGDDPLIFSEMNADSAVMTLDANGQPTKIRLGGDPGTTRIDVKGAGGGGRL